MSADQTIAPKVLVETVGPVTTIIINRPEHRNAVDGETALLLRQAFVDFDADDNASVAVLCGTGSSFCAGYDLKFLSLNGLEDDPGEEGPMGPSRMLVGKPVIAAVEGYAVAGGLELALLCDMRVASETAVFGVFCRRWGVPLIDGGTVRLPRVIGQGRALDMILTGRPVDAQEAMLFGLANRLVGAGEARHAAEELALEIARFPQVCMRSDRMSAQEQWSLPLGAALQHEAKLGAAARLIAGDGATRFASGRGRGGDFSEL
ncbi:enoyl-CoA hydratase [Sphingomonas sp. Leaf357]|uniref:crotonase/enoyl-CoA hydratase family protein n=1 Tax=Sphingomonas sp. Leaf357 TaxID=1736350 RepID=UPI0006FC8747|nr:crotonase/enoyl-CoA hydratase family protein [Sphingomonas sp. Leaf357]KQS03608.1 enoyl-CoA hydratase [Sphingomonas sp. Leaf357]